MNPSMWRKALTVIPTVSKDEWRNLDPISRWLISTRAAVLVMTFFSALLAGLFAWRDNAFSLWPWLALTLGLLMAHASNNLFNDFTDYSRGVDQGNYHRSAYGPQPLVHGLMTRGEHFIYFLVTGLLALACGLYLLWRAEFDPLIWVLLLIGAFFLLFYTWPLKYIALGEVAVLFVWGPLMVSGGYYVLARQWDWSIFWAGIIYALGVTTVIFGKHIDKIEADREKRIRTLPVLIGESASRIVVIGLMLMPYLILSYLVWKGGFSPLLFIVLLGIPRLRQVLPAFLQPKPNTRPSNFPEGQGGWPLFFAPLAFWYNRAFGSLFIVGLIADILLRKLIT